MHDSRGSGAIVSHKRIVLADPDDDLRGTLTELFVKRGHSVSPCRSGAELIDELDRAFRPDAAERVDMVISDVALPGIAGLSILAGVATSPAHCSVILTNPIGGNEVHVEAMRLCAAAIFEKPLNLEQFLARVERVLARAHRS